ncbi:MAG TPA: ATP-dependent helicase [Nevskiaceae bacterium]|nr:ATP-dependent helicase [Nevskiaceae bacterium]
MQLNPEQLRAVEAPNGPVLIVAGPGTGKTKTLVARITHLIEQGIPAEDILALTFTNKAAREMRERVGSTGAQITTFHALCNSILTKLDGKKPLFVAEAERQQIIRTLKKSQELKGLSVRELGLQISRAKNSTQASNDPALAKLITAYNAELQARNLCDFDDLLLRLYDHLQGAMPNTTYQAILVDEFQDTNGLQYELLKLLNSTDNLFVIGDPKQSIYGFRGASAGVFDRFKTDWPNATEIALTINYRSAPDIVALGNAIFSNATQLTPHQTQLGHVQVMQLLSEYSEARWIIAQVERAIGGSTMLKGSEHHAQDTGCTFRDFAVLYRSHATAKPLQRLLDESGIPFQVAGEGTPYQRPDIARILNALSYIAGKIEQPQLSGLTTTQAQILLDPLKTTQQTLPDLVQTIVKVLNVATDDNRQDLQQLLNSLIRFKDAAAYLEYVQTIAEQEFYDPLADAVTLLTIHAAKGLEFKHVFVIGANEGLLPHYRPGQQPNIDEERRLFYVAVTRAKQNLDILHAKTRGGKPARLSRFITELPADVLKPTTDPDMAAQVRKSKLRHYKKAQGSLF